MKPKPQPRDAFELFQAHFDQLLDRSHELVVLAKKIDWRGMEAAFTDCYCPEIGAPAKAGRLFYALIALRTEDQGSLSRLCRCSSLALPLCRPDPAGDCQRPRLIYAVAA